VLLVDEQCLKYKKKSLLVAKSHEINKFSPYPLLEQLTELHLGKTG
jgi:hypothetical protein